MFPNNRKKYSDKDQQGNGETQTNENSHQETPLTSNDMPPGTADVTEESVYAYYENNLIPAIKASLPFLMRRIGDDCMAYLNVAGGKVTNFLLPGLDGWSNPNFVQLLENAASNSTLTEFMIRHFDTNKDGQISPAELLNMTDFLAKIHSPQPTSWVQWFSSSWPLMDWKVGVFLWRSCGGLLFVIAVASLLPGRLHGILGKILRWPVLGLTYFLIWVEFLVYVVIRLFIRLVETVFANSKHRTLRRKMRNSQSYDEWYQHSMELDISQGREAWRKHVNNETSHRYNWSFIKELIRDMRKAKQKGDSLWALAVLQQCTRKNVGGVMSEECFSFTNTGEPKYLIAEFIEEVASTLHWVTEEALAAPVDNVPILSREEQNAYEKKFARKSTVESKKLWTTLVEWATLEFARGDDGPKAASQSSDGMSVASDNTPIALGYSASSYHIDKLIMTLKRARAAYGRTALVLSGGAMMGCYHFGHVKALLEAGGLPTIISGTSAGSVVAAIVCTRTDEEILQDIRPEILSQKLKCFKLSYGERLKNLWKKGCMYNNSDWREMIKWFSNGDLTFEEAYRKTGRIMCITLSSTTKKSPPVLLNYISAPNVVIGSAVIASAAVPGFIEPVRLEVKGPDGKISYQGDVDELYWDGSIEQDIPTSGLAEMFNCQFFIAAQCNPHIVPFFFNCKGGVGRPSRWSRGGREDAWRGGFLLSALELYLKTDMKAKFQFLHEIEAAVGFTSTLMTQQFVGTTTIVPHASFIDYFKLFSDPTFEDLCRYEQAGAIAAYEHLAMIKLHYHVADALDECLDRLESSSASLDSVGDNVGFGYTERITVVTLPNDTDGINATTNGIHKR